MSTIRVKELRALEDAAKKVESFLEASRGNEASCGSFRQDYGGAAFTDEQKRQVRLYIETWVAEPLVAALNGIHGDRSWENEMLLDTYGSRFSDGFVFRNQ